MFKYLLATQWQELSPALQKHYDINEGENITMQGYLEVQHGRFIKLLMPLIRLTGALVPVSGKNFLVTVSNHQKDNIFYWQRNFEKYDKHYLFKSKMQIIDNDIIEFVGLGIGIRMGLSVKNKALIYEDKGYVLCIGHHIVPIPLHLLMGKATIKEFVSSDGKHDISMKFIVKHPLFGFAFSYQGYLDFI
jgi:hypothetical protein